MPRSSNQPLERLYVGREVDYWSSSFKCWAPTVVTSVDPETGDVRVKVRRDPLTFQEAVQSLRPRVKPEPNQMRWVKMALRDGLVLEEAKRLFLHHALMGTTSGSSSKRSSNSAASRITLGDFVVVTAPIRYTYHDDPSSDYSLMKEAKGVVTQVDKDGDFRVDWGPEIGHKWVLGRSCEKLARVYLDNDGFAHVGEEIDALLGSSGSTYELTRRSKKEMRRVGVNADGWQTCRTSDGDVYYKRGQRERWDWPGTHPHLSFGVFREIFWEMMSTVHSKWGWALPRERCAPRPRPKPSREEYKLLKKLGQGSYGTVSLYLHIGTGCRRAVKAIASRQAKGLPNTADSEIGRLSLLDHPNIVKLYEHWEDTEQVYLAMDFCSGGELNDAFKAHRKEGLPIEEPIVADIMRQIFRAVAHIHAHGLLHLDLKCANVMLSPEERRTLAPSEQGGDEMASPGLLTDPQRPPHVMVIDLGLATIFRPGDYKNKKICGTPQTMSPEAWLGVHTPAADVFSCGIMLFQLLALNYPFEAPTDSNGAIAYWTKLPKPKSCKLWRGNHASDAAYELCERAMQLHRLDRPSATECLQAPFFTDSSPGRARESVMQSRPMSSRVRLPERVGMRLAKVPEKSLLHRSVALSLASSWPADRLPTIKRAFQQLDTIGTGRLTKERITRALCQTGIDAESAAVAADAMDLTRDGMVNWTEFVASCIHLGSSALDEDLKRVFREADRDGDGLLDRDDVARLLGSDHLQGEVDELLECLVGEQNNESAPSSSSSSSSSPTIYVDFPRFRRHFVSVDMKEN